MAQAQFKKISLELPGNCGNPQLQGNSDKPQLQGKLVCEAYHDYCLVRAGGGVQLVKIKHDETQEWRFTPTKNGSYFIQEASKAHLNHDDKKVLVKEAPMEWKLEKCSEDGDYVIVPAGWSMLAVGAVDKTTVELKNKGDTNEQKWSIVKYA